MEFFTWIMCGKFEGKDAQEYFINSAYEPIAKAYKYFSQKNADDSEIYVPKETDPFVDKLLFVLESVSTQLNAKIVEKDRLHLEPAVLAKKAHSPLPSIKLSGNAIIKFSLYLVSMESVFSK